MLLTHMVQAQFHPLKFKNMINTKTINSLGTEGQWKFKLGCKFVAMGD